MSGPFAITTDASGSWVAKRALPSGGEWRSVRHASKGAATATANLYNAIYELGAESRDAEVRTLLEALEFIAKHEPCKAEAFCRCMSCGFIRTARAALVTRGGGE